MDPAPLKARVAGPSLAEKCAFLESCAARPGQPRPEVIETHTAMVFLGQDTVWKMKTPVRLPFLDFSRLSAREHACREEVRLNRVLAGKEVYRDVLALTLRADGLLALEGSGRVVDWLVEMRRLPAGETLDNRLRDGRPPERSEIGRVAERMQEFYRMAPRPKGAGEGYLERWMREGRVNAGNLAEMAPHLGAAFKSETAGAALALMEANRGEIMERAGLGLIVEGHGDLRPEHVCLENPPVIFDRLEFDPILRLADPFEEMNYLGLECEALGAAWIRSMLLTPLLRSGLKPPGRQLMKSYGVNRCLTRARLAIDHLRDAEIRTPEKWPLQARFYLERAKMILTGTRAD